MIFFNCEYKVLLIRDYAWDITIADTIAIVELQFFEDVCVLDKFYIEEVEGWDLVY